MSEILIELAFGPVHGFINAARRSRDLWVGSFLLSDLARAAGKSLIDGGAELIYPLSSRVLQDCDDENSNLSNVLLARCHADSMQQAAGIAGDAQQAARDALQIHADQAFKTWTHAGVQLRGELWNLQVADSIETYAAWSVIEADGYRPAYERLKASFAARKNTRNFAPMFPAGKEALGKGVPKSSLDGLRESVLPKARTAFPLRFGMSPGEQLDAMGCIKRVLGKQERFTALTRIAADSWLQALPPEKRESLCSAYEPLVDAGVASRSNGNDGIYATFPYDASLLFPERLELAKAECSEDAAITKALAHLNVILQPIWKAHGRPCSYAVMVVADGDRMGRFIDRAQSADQHTQVSAAVAAFADRVPAIAREYRGHCLFNGGEDLTVLFPLAGVIDGARALARQFNECMADVSVELLGKAGAINSPDRPTLRVGAAICHVLEPLGVIRAKGEAAEVFAKGEAGRSGQGNALGLCLHERVGHEIRLRLGFDDPSAFDQLAGWVSAYADGKLPAGLAYRIRDAYLRCSGAGLGEHVTAHEVERVVRHANERGGQTALSTDMQDKLCALASTGDEAVARLADELILARWLSAKTDAELNQQVA